MSLKRKIYIIILLSSLIPLLLLGSLMIAQNNWKMAEVTEKSLESISQAQILSLSSFCETQRSSLEMIAQLELVQDAVNTSLTGSFSRTDPVPRYLTNILKKQKLYYPHFETLTVVDLNYEIVASAVDFPADEDARELEDIDKRYLTGEFIMTDVYDRAYVTGTKAVIGAYQGIYFDGALVGYVIAEIPITYFDRYRTECNLSEGDILHILDGKNRVIAAGNAAKPVYDVFAPSPEELASFMDKWNAIDLAKNPSGHITHSAGDTRYITYYAAIPYTDWGIRMTADLTLRQQSAQEYRALLYIVITVILVILLIVGIVLANALTRPIDRIVDVLKEVQDNEDYSLRIDLKQKGELGFLAREVNALLAFVERADIEDKRNLRHLALEAESDPLTGVKNKKAIAEITLSLLSQAAQEGRRVAVGFLDIDNFKAYNTRYGHQQGDAVIQFVASVLSDAVDGVVGRCGGDEFVFCITDVDGVEDVTLTAQKIMAQLNHGCPDITTGELIAVPCSVGIVVDGGASMNYSTMIAHADRAMYRAKENGKNRFCVLTPDMEYAS